MVLPIVAYGDPVLRKVAIDINKDYPKLNELIYDMFHTMYHAKGVGLAAPQVGCSIRLFVVDASAFAEDVKGEEQEQLKKFKKVFINAKLVEEEGEEWKFNEGCLSIPKVREDILRKPGIRIQYYDEKFNSYDEKYKGLAARIIQHEYDHIDGVLFTDKISPMRKRLLNKKLLNISKGDVDVEYKMRFFNKK